MLSLLLFGCASPGTRYRVLSVFFDGVPSPDVQTEPFEAEATTEVDEVEAPARPAGSRHGPFAKRQCEVCHDLGRSNELKGKRTEICRTCHTEDMFEGAVVHGPVAAGQCYGCHDAHQSRFPHLLFDAGSALCDRCHDVETFAAAQQHRTDKGEDCLGCHRPHVADKAYLLR